MPLDKLRSIGNVLSAGGELNSNVIMASGSAQVVSHSKDGKAVNYATLREGDFFGELAAIDDLPRSAWVKTKNRLHDRRSPTHRFCQWGCVKSRCLEGTYPAFIRPNSGRQ